MKTDLFALIIGKVVLDPCLIFWRCGWCQLLLGNLWILEQTCSRNLSTSRHNGTKRAPRDAKIGPRVLPRDSEKQVATKRASARTFQASCSKMGTQIWKFWSILANIFRCFSVSFSMVPKLNFRSFWDQFWHHFDDSLRFARRSFWNYCVNVHGTVTGACILRF